MAGNSSVSRRANEASPKTTNAIIVTTVMIGRLMAKSEMNMVRRYGLHLSSSLSKNYICEPLQFFTPLPISTSEKSTMKYGKLVMVALTALTVSAVPAQAQFPHLSVMGGVTMPKGDASTADNMG